MNRWFRHSPRSRAAAVGRDAPEATTACVSEDFFMMDCLSTLAKEPRSGGQPHTVRSDRPRSRK
jgi:hypothetical protein